MKTHKISFLRGLAKSLCAAPFLSLLVLLCACSAGAPGTAPDPADEVWDPLESINRPIFWFNDKTFDYVLLPIADGYDYITPKAVQKGIENAFANIQFPIYLLSDLVQLKMEQAAVHTGRFVLNTTVGLGGLFDVAKDVGLKHHEEDFGTALGYWGISAGPYIVWPFLGPSNLRDSVGMLVDYAADPINYHYYIRSIRNWDTIYYTLGTGVLPRLNSINQIKGVIKRGKKASIDYYLFAQGAYHQMRLSLITDGASEKDPFDEESDDDWDDDLDDEDDQAANNR